MNLRYTKWTSEGDTRMLNLLIVSCIDLYIMLNC